MDGTVNSLLDIIRSLSSFPLMRRALRFFIIRLASLSTFIIMVYSPVIETTPLLLSDVYDTDTVCTMLL